MQPEVAQWASNCGKNDAGKRQRMPPSRKMTLASQRNRENLTDNDRDVQGVLDKVHVPPRRNPA